MTNYNDGKWHGWNGGECPVHQLTEVVVKWSCNGVETNAYPAKNFSYEWSGKSICAFRVVKEHREPREWYIDTLNGDAYEPTQIASHFILNPAVVLVREVLE